MTIMRRQNMIIFSASLHLNKRFHTHEKKNKIERVDIDKKIGKIRFANAETEKRKRFDCTVQDNEENGNNRQE